MRCAKVLALLAADDDVASSMLFLPVGALLLYASLSCFSRVICSGVPRGVLKNSHRSIGKESRTISSVRPAKGGMLGERGVALLASKWCGICAHVISSLLLLHVKPATRSVRVAANIAKGRGCVRMYE